jgi:hypothetical protein
MVTKSSKSTKVSKSTSIELLLTSPLTEVCELQVDKKMFKKLTKTGVTEDEYDEIKDELESSTEFYSLVYDESYPRISLEIDGEVDESFEKQFDELYKNASQKINTNKNIANSQNETEIRYALLWDRYYKRTFWKLTISERFDPSKFSIELNTETIIGGNEYTGFIPYYDGKEFEFSSDHGFDVDEIMLIDSEDKRYEIEIKDED